MNSSDDSSIAESSLRQTWSIGPLRPWLLLLAQRQMPADLRGKVDPSDLVQQALLDAWRGQTGFRGTTHAERLAWLRVILTRTMMRQRRDLLATEKRGMGREKTLQAAVDRDSVQLERLAVGNEPDPQSAAARAEQTLRLAATLEKLSSDHRTVLTLRHIDGLTHEQIAEQMGKTSAAVRMLWIRALEKLKQLHGN